MREENNKSSFIFGGDRVGGETLSYYNILTVIPRRTVFPSDFNGNIIIIVLSPLLCDPKHNNIVSRRCSPLLGFTGFKECGWHYTLNDPKYCTARRHLTPLSVVIHTTPLTHKHVLLFHTVILCYFTLMIFFFFFLFPRSLSIDWMNERRRSKKKSLQWRSYRYNTISLCAYYYSMVNGIPFGRVVWK